MESISKVLVVEVDQDKAFNRFVHDLNEWWPKEYTWSQKNLVDIKMDPEKNGLCTELGPYNFRCDWGRVTTYEPPLHLSLKWQISSQRIPEPDPEKASDIIVNFKENADGNTIVEFTHMNFQKHGYGAEDYQKAMDSEQGWDYILDRYKSYCER
jgi:uncharacterized protein YndB with AHSA1/START domain